MAYIGTGTLSPISSFLGRFARILLTRDSMKIRKNSSNEGFYEDSQEICALLTNQQFSCNFCCLYLFYFIVRNIINKSFFFSTWSTQQKKIH